MSTIDIIKKNRYCYIKSFKMQRHTNNYLNIQYILSYTKNHRLQDQNQHESLQYSGNILIFQN